MAERAQVEGLLAQLDSNFGQEGWFASLSQAVSGVTAAQAAWVPGPGLNSIWQIVNHVTFWKEVYGNRLAGGPRLENFPGNDSTFGAPGDPTDEAGWLAAVERLQTAHAALRREIEKRSDADLLLSIDNGDWTIGRHAGGLIGHDAYHGGQIILLRRLQGSWSREG